ncbi:MAG: DUF2934 domain-containing protein [Sulfuritalea sp.]|nr:DUF2934 domain-containing protein [Sulfuritalea sp.]
MKTSNDVVKKIKSNGKAKPTRSPESSRFSAASSNCSREQLIAEAAYFRAEKRGFAPGDEVSDWLQAEVEVESQSRNGA